MSDGIEQQESCSTNEQHAIARLSLPTGQQDRIVRILFLAGLFYHVEDVENGTKYQVHGSNITTGRKNE